MGSLEKFAQAIAVVGQKREAIDNGMKLIMREWEAVEKKSKAIQDLSARAAAEVGLKEKHSKAVVESVKVSYEMLKSKKRWLEEGLKALDEKVKNVIGFRKEAEAELVQARVMKDSVDKQLEELALKEQQFQDLSKNLNMTLSHVEERKSELDLMEKALNGRKDEMDSRQKQLEAKELEACAELKKMKEEMEAKMKSLVEREGLIASKETALVDRESEFARKQKFWETKFESRKASPFERRGGKRRRSGDGSAEHIKAHPHPKNSGSDYKLQTKSSEVVLLDDSKFNSEVRAGSVLKDTQKQELVRYSVGQTWACFDAKDRMPRRYVRILSVFEQGDNVHLLVEWMKPSPKSEVEKEWISAGLPVGCGTFKPWRTSYEYPRILFQPIFSAGNPCIIVPFQGETWAIYKDWNIKTWSSRPDIHSRCKYDICEILPYPQSSSSSVAVRVAFLEKVRGSTCSFQRRSKKEEDSLLIEAGSLYRFSHKVPSSKSSSNDPNDPAGVFVLDQNALPLGL